MASDRDARPLRKVTAPGTDTKPRKRPVQRYVISV